MNNCVCVCRNLMIMMQEAANGSFRLRAYAAVRQTLVALPGGMSETVEPIYFAT